MKSIKGAGDRQGKGSGGLSWLCDALLPCGCGRFDISGAFNPGTGNRWCWEIKLLSPQPCRSVPGASASLSLSLSSYCSACSQCLSFIFLAVVSYLLAPSFVSVVGRMTSLPHPSPHAPPVVFVITGKQKK